MSIKMTDVIEGISLLRKISTRPYAGVDPVEQTIEWDFTGCSIQQVIHWAERTVRIEYQKRVRTMEYPTKFMQDNPSMKIKAIDAGKKVLTIDEAVAMIPEELREGVANALIAKRDKGK